MANVPSPISVDFTATGTTDDVTDKLVKAYVTGTFVATVVVQIRTPDGNWAPSQNGTLTAPDVVVVDTGRRERVRVECAQYTSGTATVELDASETEDT